MATKRQAFFSFEYIKDNWRASEVRKMGVVSKDSTFSDNDWEEVKEKSDKDIKKWIDNQMAMRSCIVVLIGSTTSTRKWVKYEIEKAYELGKGIVGIYINKLKDKNDSQSPEGNSPFYNIYIDDGHRLSHYVTAFKSEYASSKYVYNDIKDHISDLIENAINDAGTY